MAFADFEIVRGVAIGLSHLIRHFSYAYKQDAAVSWRQASVAPDSASRDVLVGEVQPPLRVKSLLVLVPSKFRPLSWSCLRWFNTRIDPSDCTPAIRAFGAPIHGLINIPPS